MKWDIERGEMGQMGQSRTTIENAHKKEIDEQTEQLKKNFFGKIGYERGK